MAAPAPDYFPLAPGLVLDYATKTPFSAGTLRFEVLSVSKKRQRLTARCRHVVFEDDRAKTSEFEIVKDADAVLSRGFKEFPIPPDVGARWEEEPRSYEIESAQETADLPAGRFAACLKVSYLIAGGDGGGGYRLYAPGVGFIYEACSDVGEPFEILLTRAHLL